MKEKKEPERKRRKERSNQRPNGESQNTYGNFSAPVHDSCRILCFEETNLKRFFNYSF